jgi:putative membrane protein insertion efficiency factor
LYQYLLSPLLPPACRYAPSCSAFAHEAIWRFGILHGVILSLTRLERCHPLGGMGHDPVPDHFSWKTVWQRVLRGPRDHPVAISATTETASNPP